MIKVETVPSEVVNKCSELEWHKQKWSLIHIKTTFGRILYAILRYNSFQTVGGQ